MAGTLTFKFSKLVTLYAAAVKEWKAGVKPLWLQPETIKEGFWIVGDQGVYLMSNGKGRKGKPNTLGEDASLCYSQQCDPLRMDFDDWYENKERTFGGDDGAEFIDKETIEGCIANQSDLKIKFTRKSMTCEWTKKKEATPQFREGSVFSMVSKRRWSDNGTKKIQKDYLLCEVISFNQKTNIVEYKVIERFKSENTAPFDVNGGTTGGGFRAEASNMERLQIKLHTT